MQTDDELEKHDAFMPNIWSGEAKHYKDSLLSVWGRSITEFILRIYSTDTSQCV